MMELRKLVIKLAGTRKKSSHFVLGFCLYMASKLCVQFKKTNKKED